MADQFQGLLPSILDRLIDPDTETGGKRLGYTLLQMIHAVRRDLEELLNTRQTNAGIPKHFTEVHGSIVGYGLPDFSTVNAATAVERERIGGVVGAIIARFEPRLRDVKVTLIENQDQTDRTVRFRIDARLAVDPAPEVEFETVLELLSGRTSVEARRV
jgi:type VI secretion system protein ImpF